MRRVNNIFEQKSRGTGIRSVWGVKLTLLICSVLSGLAAIGIIANFETVTARIAIFMANLLPSGFLILAAVITVVYFIARRKRRLF